MAVTGPLENFHLEGHSVDKLSVVPIPRLKLPLRGILDTNPKRQPTIRVGVRA